MTMNLTAVRCPAVVVLYFVFMGLYPVLCDINKFRILDINQHGKIGDIATLNCTASTNNATVQWFFKDKLLNESENNRLKIVEKNGMQLRNDDDGNALTTKTSTVTITNITSEDAGNYTCVAKHGALVEAMVINLNLSFKAKILNITKTQHVYMNDSNVKKVTLECEFEVYHLTEIKWYKNSSENTLTPNPHLKLDERRYKSSVVIPIYNFDENGTYVCEVSDDVTPSTASGSVDIMVYIQPIVTIIDAFGISTTEVFLNWSLSRYNTRIEDISIQISISNDTAQGFSHLGHKVDPKNTSEVVSGLKRKTNYTVKFVVGEKKKIHFTKEFSESKSVETLDFDPVFVPNISINGFSATSVTIAWAPPPADIEKYIHYYLLEARKKGENVPRKAYHSRDSRNLPYMFDNLEPHSTYIFQVCACAFYVTQRCGNWSEQMEAATLDGIPSKPTKVHMECGPDHLNITWDEPDRPNAEIKGYTMELTGNASFKDRYGKLRETTWGPLSKFTKNNTRRDSFQDLQPNTTYTVRLSAMTRTRRRGEEHVDSCRTWPAPPDQPPRPRWRKIFQDKKYLFKMYLPRITERNGHICCYRVYMVRLSAQTVWEDLSLPEYQDVPVYNHSYVHAHPSVSGAYITDIFSNDNFPADSELVMGDSISHYNESDGTLFSDACRRCLIKPKKDEVTTTTTSTTTTTTTVKTTTVDEMFDQDDLSTDDPASVETTIATRRRRSYSDPYSNDPIMQDRVEEPFKPLVPIDGPLDPTAKYTLYVELIPGQVHEKSMFSNYVNVLEAAPTPPVPQPASTLEIALQVTCAVAAVVLLLMIVFCIRQTRRSRKAPHHAPLEMNTLERAIRWMFPSGRGRGSAPAAPPDVPPIAQEDLAAAYAERQLDSDYLFQKEFELLQMLPECYPDRTTHASEARENQPKNRYPDIKAYDQTRVKLTQIDSITGSNYINANYVTGYKERKQFICAQGPTDTTVNDFWRMIWEHRLELIVMLTNLEEYSKVKCSKYWPDELRGSRAFGTVTVHHVSEKRYSDYIVRELRITKQQTNSDGQPIVENNGVAKRNGDIKEAADGSVPTSPREVKEAECRTVRQYHFLMWKDFAAPEHAYSILKFIKRVNEAWASTLSRPVVVHCSAGVGRTGTLVALDCLLQQLKAEGHAAVFNTVCELRRQRNFLVQSLKQYVFVYRALVEYTVYGDTEIPASRLKAAVDRLRNTPPGATTSLMEIEFEKILNSPIAEPVKSCAAGAAEELRAKNRSQDILPYDRNRVILAPVPGRDFSTYINASFIEAYDNSEGFIITQDPLPNTIMDFWRMVSEHNVTTIVMLSELGEGKCPRYWEDGVAQYEHISVQYEESESCPYYTRRQFRLINNKSGVSQCVRQLQYQGWPTAPGHVPEVTRGLAELADAAASDDPGTMLVHCQLGTERSSLFVCLCILISQIRCERRVDVCCVARKVRSQRAHTIDTFLHYEFLHRAILNYAELHNLLEDS